MNDFENFLYNEINAALAKIDAATTADIYVLSFYIFDVDDDPRHPVLQLGYNTRTRMTECIRLASSPQEATWDFSFWLQNELLFVGEPGTGGGQLWEAYLRDKGLYYSDKDEEADFEHCMQMAGEITSYFVGACVRVAQALHATKVIEQKFQGGVPIVVHELEYNDEIALQTRLANPPGLTEDFENWVASM